MPLMRRSVLALLCGHAPAGRHPAAAATPAETFVNDNIQKSLSILRDKKLTTDQRRDQFQALLLTLVDVPRIALFTLGQYRRTAPRPISMPLSRRSGTTRRPPISPISPKYTDQVLKVTGSTERSPTDFIVQSQLIDPGSSQPPAEVAFRVRTDGGKPVLVDVAYQGIWLSLEQRDQFVAFLGQNKRQCPHPDRPSQRSGGQSGQVQPTDRNPDGFPPLIGLNQPGSILIRPQGQAGPVS